MMQLETITLEHGRIRDDQSPNNAFDLNVDLLINGSEVHYLQPISNSGKIIIDCLIDNAKYKAVLALSKLGEPIIFDTGLEQIPVVFDYRQTPCVQWLDTRKIANPLPTRQDLAVIYLKAI